jgi:hypothetical protein
MSPPPPNPVEVSIFLAEYACEDVDRDYTRQGVDIPDLLTAKGSPPAGKIVRVDLDDTAQPNDSTNTLLQQPLEPEGIREHACKILDGGEAAFARRGSIYKL